MLFRCTQLLPPKSSALTWFGETRHAMAAWSRFQVGHPNDRGNFILDCCCHNMSTTGASETPVCDAGASLNTSDAICANLASPITQSVSTSSVKHDRRRKAPISFLPVELLAIIFREVYRSSRSNPKWNPWTIASVCPFWEFALSLTPEFWTRLAFSLDTPSFSAAFISRLLVRSHNLVLQMVTFTRNIRTSMHDAHERVRVIVAMHAIAPHIHRCRAIAFNVRFSSSLPTLPVDFHRKAKHLRSLELRCTEDNGGVISTVGGMNLPPLHRAPFQCPNLHALAISGRNYFIARKQNVKWTELFPALSRISISHFAPVANRSESFTTSELLLSLVPFRHCLTYLSINDLHLDDSPTPMSDDYDESDDGDFPELRTISLKDMHKTRHVAQILDFLGGCPSNVYITRCRLGPQYLLDGGAYSLSLTEIDVGENLVEFLRDCLTEKLVINRCPGFRNEVLNAMMTFPPGPGPNSCAWNVEELSILNCLSFSISTLKQLVETKYTLSKRHPEHVCAYPRIRVLHLSGYVPYVSPEDRLWFEGHLSEFSYNPIQSR